MKKIYLLVIAIATSLSLDAQVVISQVYGGGGNTSATYTHDFVELYNKGAASVDISGWSVQYASATGTAWAVNAIPASSSIGAGKYFLVKLAGGATGIALPTPDADITTSPSNMSGTAGKVALVSNTTALSGSNVSTGYIDLLGYSSSSSVASSSENTPFLTTGISNAISIQRGNNGCNDTNNNSVDFALGSVNPRNSSTAAFSCNATTIAITSPPNSTVFSPETTNVNVALSISNFAIPTGKIKYTINGGAAQYKTTFDNTNDNTIAIPTVAGQTYTIVTELVDASNASIVPAKTATVNFSVASYTNVADLATLRTQTVNGYYNLLSAPVTTHVRPMAGTGMATRNQKYAEDATAGILIDDANGVLNGLNIAENESLTGLKGQLTSFSSVLQFVPLTTTGVTNAPATPVTPTAVSIADIVANPAGYKESQLVDLGNVAFSALTGTQFVVSTNYTISQGADQTTLRTIFNQTGEVDYIGTDIPGSANVIALISRSGTNKQVAVRRLADFSNLSVKDNNIAGLKVFPNPAKTNLFITSDSFAAKTVEIFNVLGAKVLTTQVNNSQVNVSSLKTGVYMVKITEEGKTGTVKLVIE